MPDMTDGQAAAAKPARPPTDAQLVVAMAIVIVLGAIGLALIGAGTWALVNKDAGGTGVAFGGVGTIIGALATALNAPNGITSALVRAVGQ